MSIFDAPIERRRFKVSRSTEARPVTVVTTTGKKAIRNPTITFGSVPYSYARKSPKAFPGRENTFG
jgi:hypothetical protein